MRESYPARRRASSQNGNGVAARPRDVPAAPEAAAVNGDAHHRNGQHSAADDPISGYQTAFLVPRQDDVAEIKRLSPRSTVQTIEWAAGVSDNDALDAIEGREVLAILPGNSPAWERAEARSVLSRLRRFRPQSARIAVCPQWASDKAFPSLSPTLSGGAAIAWLRNLPGLEVLEPERPVASFSNFVERAGRRNKPIRDPLSIREIEDRLYQITGGWPKRVGENLFLEGDGHQPVMLDTDTRLFAWIDTRAMTEWAKGERCVPQSRFYEHLRMSAERFDAIETLPHFPRLARTYYMHQAVIKTESGPAVAMDGLLDYFVPGSEVDRELIKAFILTLFAGLTPGNRPGFLITGKEADEGQGRGLGKTKLVDILSEELVGGSIDVNPSEDIATVKTRLLSPAARHKRVAKLDNLKTLRFSWADLEGLITASEISGRQMYVGEGRRPNNLVWAITLNGASLSKDMAQRVVVIQLDRFTRRATWEHEVREYIRANRQNILGDIRMLLEDTVEPIEPRTRWAPWESAVLSALDDPRAAQDVILARQDSVDDDNEERDLVCNAFRSRIEELHPNDDRVSIPATTAAEILSQTLRRQFATNHSTSYLKGLGIKELQYARTKDQRGWIWTKENGNPKSEPAEFGKPSPVW